MALDGLTTGVTLVNATGMKNDLPFISRVVSLDPGASVAIPLQFRDPSNVRINFTPMIFQE